MPDLLTADDLQRLFASFQRTARRLEPRDAYASPQEDEAVRRFLAGEEVDVSWRGFWLELVSGAVSAGKRFERVRVVADPPTGYQRYGLWSSQFNVAAGEDIRYLRRDRANALNLPSHDFWVFDSAQLAVLYFSADHRFIGAHVVTELAVVRQHERWLDTAVEHAAPYQEYLERSDGVGWGPTDA